MPGIKTSKISKVKGKKTRGLKYIDKALIEKVVLRIKKLREQKEISLLTFYNDTNVHQARIESKKHDISLSQLSRICNYLDISLEEFFKGM